MDAGETNRVAISQNFGWTRDISPRDIPLGAWTELTNLQDVVAGEIRSRKGLAPASDYTAASPTAYDILSVAPYASPLAPTVITVDANGVCRARRGGATFTVKSSLSTSVPWRFCTTRDNQIIAVNGLERGFIWRGAETAAVNLGVDPPTANLTVSLASTGGLSEGSYQVAYRYVDKNTQRSDYAYSDLSTPETYTATEGQKFSWDLSSVVPAPGRATHVQAWRTAVGATGVFYYVTEQAVGSATTYSDTATDQDLISAAADDPTKRLLVAGRYGTVARRFSPPPKTKGAVVQFRDRLFYGVDVPYDTGTLSTTNGDATVTGTGTAWLSSFAGRYLWIDGSTKPYEILSVTNGTSLELTENAAASLSGKTYRILPDPAERNQIFYSALDEPESVAVTFAVTVQAVQGDDEEITALLPFKSSLIVFKSNHAYSLTFSKEPAADGSAQYAFARGCLNQGCYHVHEGLAYVLDSTGAYTFGPSSAPEPISDVIRSLWRDGTIDFSDARWFFAHVDPASKIARFFVKFTGDSGDRPTRALCYHTVHKNWWLETWSHSFGGAALVTEDGKVRTVVGANYDRCLYLDEGELDGIDEEISGTATSATSGTLTDSGASFGASDVLKGVSVVIYEGTGRGQQRLITANTGTQLTVSPNWTTTPDTTSKYVVGGVAYRAKTGFIPIIDDEAKEQQQNHLHLTVEPISRDRPLFSSRYWNFEATADVRPDGGTSPDRLITWERGDTAVRVPIHLTAKTDASGAGANTGSFTIASYSKHPSTRHQGRTHFAVDLFGGKGDEQVRIHKLEISGVGK